ncbi:MAG TPA: hypothetical protein VGM88_29265 [Kofleriaceae bacterium]|jgi:hypothetical protein
MRALVLVLVGGCAFLPKSLSLTGADYDLHGDCYEDRFRIDNLAWGAMCDRAPTAMSDETYALDPDRDTVNAAGFVAMCAGDRGLCDPSGEHYSPLAVAKAYLLAERIEPAAAEAAFDRTEAPGWVKRAFPQRYTADRARIRALVAAQGPHFRALLIDPVVHARETWTAAADALAAWGAKIDALAARADEAILAKAVKPPLLDETLALRRAYVGACTKVRGDAMTCLGDPLGAKLARLVARLSTIDPALAVAERTIRPLDLGDVHVAEREAFRAAHGAEQDAIAARKQAVDAGIGDAALRKRWPDPLIELSGHDAAIATGGSEPPRLAVEYPDGRATRESHRVRAVRRFGASAILDWERSTDEEDEGYGCHDTNHITAIDDHGNLSYEQTCAGYRHTSTDATPTSITVPLVEATQIKPKDDVAFAFDEATHRGHVIEVSRAEKTIQRGEWRCSSSVP